MYHGVLKWESHIANLRNLEIHTKQCWSLYEETYGMPNKYLCSISVEKWKIYCLYFLTTDAYIHFAFYFRNDCKNKKKTNKKKKNQQLTLSLMMSTSAFFFSSHCEEKI